MRTKNDNESTTLARGVWESHLEGLARKACELLTQTGGWSLAWDGTSPTEGYVVSEAGSELKLTNPSYEGGLEYLRTHQSEVCGGYLFGGWLDSGTLYLDLSKVYPSLEGAVAAGHANNQLAIYHLEEGVTIPLPPCGWESI